MYWILGKKSEVSIENKLLIYKIIPKPIWTYGIPLWGTASTSNIEILQRYKNKVLRAIVNAPWNICNKVLHTDLKVPKIREGITKFSVKYRDKITTLPNEPVSTLLEEEEPRRLKRFKTDRFNNEIFVNIISQLCEHTIWRIFIGILLCKTCTK
jgi:hypothetical protein